MPATVLICDDEEGIAWALRKACEKRGHRAAVAATAEDALAKVKADPPDAAFLDVRLPGMDGLTALAELRQTQREAAEPARVARMISIVAHREGHALATAVEAAKIALTADEMTTIAFTGEEASLTVPVTRPELSTALREAIARIDGRIGDMLALAAIDAGAVREGDRVGLLGIGSGLNCLMLALEW